MLEPIVIPRIYIVNDKKYRKHNGYWWEVQSKHATLVSDEVRDLLEELVRALTVIESHKSLCE